MANFLLFFLSAADQERIIPGSVQVTDEFIEHTHALKVGFTIADPQNGAPEIQLVWPGRIDFRADPNYPGTAPTPAAVELTQSAYESWSTAGTLRLKALDKRARALAQAASGLEVVPNCLWYFPVKLSQPFLFATIGEVLRHHVIDFFGNKIDRASGQYKKNAIAWFLQGRYGPVVYPGQRAANPMPTVVMNSAGVVTLYLATAQIREPQDGPRADFDTIAGGLPESDPSHPVNGTVPPRRVLQKLSAAMDDVRSSGGAWLPLAEPVLEPPAATAPLVPLRFRRTWKKRPNNSRYFPSQTVRIYDGQTDALLMESRLPHHGVIYCRAPSAGASFPARIQINGGMRCLKGDDDTQPLWREKATDNELTYAIAPGDPIPEIILRRPMSEEIFTEPAQATKGAACTYHSMRRTIRALANNRIAGGQLNYRATADKATPLLRQALGNAANIIKGDRPRQIIRGSNDDQRGIDIRELATSLKTVWEAFFPNGDRAYYLWQSGIGSWYEDDGTTLKPGYSDAAHVRGRGAPGAMAYFGLATLHNNPRPMAAGEDLDDYAREMTQAILTGLKPGALLQFWTHHKAFDVLRERRPTEADFAAALAEGKDLLSGHSPIFERYVLDGENAVGIHVRDQTRSEGVAVLLQSNGRLGWHSYRPDLWIAANWDE